MEEKIDKCDENYINVVQKNDTLEISVLGICEYVDLKNLNFIEGDRENVIENIKFYTERINTTFDNFLSGIAILIFTIRSIKKDPDIISPANDIVFLLTDEDVTIINCDILDFVNQNVLKNNFLISKSCDFIPLISKELGGFSLHERRMTKMLCALSLKCNEGFRITKNISKILRIDD